jgi:hypothetical protein
MWSCKSRDAESIRTCTVAAKENSLACIFSVHALLAPAPQVRRALQALPLGADEAVGIAELAARGAELAVRAERLRSKMVLRPAQSAYGALQRELGRFAGSLGSAGRLAALLRGLQVLPFPAVL